MIDNLMTEALLLKLPSDNTVGRLSFILRTGGSARHMPRALDTLMAASPKLTLRFLKKDGRWNLWSGSNEFAYSGQPLPSCVLDRP